MAVAGSGAGTCIPGMSMCCAKAVVESGANQAVAANEAKVIFKERPNQ